MSEAHTLATILTDLVKQAADAAGHADSPVPLEPCVPCNNPDHGDYQSNFAFRLGKALRTNPRAVAEAIRDAMPAHPVLGEVTVAGPGFLNFRLTNEGLAADLMDRAADDRLGGPAPGAGKTVVIDYSSPNIAKRMHIGHLRSTIIGDAIRRLHAYLGWEVVADNHIGDWGTPFGKLMVAWDRWRDDEAYAADPVGELQRLYQLFGVESKEDEALIEAARERTVLLQGGDPDTLALWQQFVDESMKEFDGIYDRLDVHFDVVHGESFYNDQLHDLIEQLLSDGTAEVSDGAVVIPFAGEDGKGLGKNPMLIRKSDGAALYGTTDLATVIHRKQTWDPERVIYVTDQRQSLHFRQVFAASRKIGIDTIDFRHLGFGILRFPGGVTASTRAGATANLVDVLDTARDKAREVVEDASRDLPEAEKDGIAEAVGVGAVKYFDLSQNPQSDIVFDWERSLSLVGNSAPYLMYAHARCCSILRNAAEAGIARGSLDLAHPTERVLALDIARVPEVVEVAAETMRPNLLCEQLFTLAQDFSSFWNACQVLGVEKVDGEKRFYALPETASRLALTAAVAHALRVGLGLLGVEAPERM